MCGSSVSLCCISPCGWCPVSGAPRRIPTHFHRVTSCRSIRISRRRLSLVCILLFSECFPFLVCLRALRLGHGCLCDWMRFLVPRATFFQSFEHLVCDGGKGLLSVVTQDVSMKRAEGVFCCEDSNVHANFLRCPGSFAFRTHTPKESTPRTVGGTAYILYPNPARERDQ
ncbi:unnamed protein product [Hapterophycus canaliculatus]